MPKTHDEPPGFEAALAELERITRDLEEGSLGLDESLARFEQGVSLLRRCYATLDAAERRIAVLTGFDADGTAVTAAFDATATAEQGVAGRRKKKRAPKGEPEPAEDSDDDAPAGRGLF